MAQNNNIHAGHRKRLRERYLQQGLDGFSDHEVLELLTTFTIPRGNTNPQGHALMQAFGTLAHVLEADVADLEQVEGIGPQSALLIHLIPALARRYMLDKQGKRPALSTGQKAGKYASALLLGAKTEQLYMMCLDAKCRLRHAVKVAEGTLDEVTVYTRSVVELAIKHGAKNVILAHNHPTGSIRPSRQDLDLTQTLLHALAAVKIQLLDHLIVGDAGVFSFVRSGALSQGTGKDVAYAAEDAIDEP